MAEFKGTKGKWERVTCDYDLNQAVFLEDTEQSICEINSKPHLQLYDALLISKAPEMLEMLTELRKFGQNHGMPYDLYEDLDKLIKEATEL